MASSKWATGTSGTWSTAANWSSASVPGGTASSDDVATIDAPGTYTVTVSNGSTGTVANPTYIGTATMNAISGTLLINTPLVVKTALNLVNGTLLFGGGTIRGGTLNLTGGTISSSASGYSNYGTLDGVRVVGTLDTSNSYAALTLLNNTTFLARDGVSAGLIRLGSGSLTFGSSFMLNNATITTAYPYASINVGDGTASTSLTLGSTAGLNVAASYSLAIGGKGTLTNGGTITVGGTLTVGPNVSLATASTPGTLTVLSGGTLAFGTAGSQTALTGLSGAQIQGTLTVNGNITTAALGAGLAGANIAGTLNLTGIVDNTATGSVLEVKAGTPLSKINLVGATIQGGTLKLTSGTLGVNLNATYSTPVLGTLDGVRVLGDIAIANYNTYSGQVLALKNGVTFAGVGGTGRGSISAFGTEIRALDPEALDHVNLSLGQSGSFNYYAALLTTPFGGVLALGSDTTLTTSYGTTIGGGGTLSYAGAFNVTGSTSVASGTTLVKGNGGVLTVAPLATLSVNWAGTTAPLAGIAGAVVNGSIALAGTLTTADYLAALGSLSGTGNIAVSGLLDNTGSTLTLGGTTVAGRLSLGGTLKGGTVAASAIGLSLGYNATLDGVTLRGPTTLAASSTSYSPAIIRNGLTLVGSGGSGPGSLTLTNQSLQAADSSTLNNAAIQLNGTSALSATIGQRLTLGAGLSVDVNGTATFSNVGSAAAITVEGNSTLNVDSTFTSTGSVNLKFGSKLNLTGTITTATLAGLIATTSGTGVVGLGSYATLDNTGTTLTLLPTGRLNAITASGVTIKGGTILASGGSLAFVGQTTLNGVTWQGAFAPTTNAQYIFTNGTAVQGVGGARALIDLAGSSSSLSLAGPVDNTDIKLGSGSLSTNSSSPVVLGAGATLAIGTPTSSAAAYVYGLINSGAVTQFGGSVTLNAVTNSGTMALSNGRATFTSLSNTGTIRLTGETITIATPTVLGGTIAFLDPTSRIVFQGTGAVGANLQGFQNGGSIDIQGLTYGSSLSVSLQGSSLNVQQGSVLVASFQLSGGGTAYSADEFSLVADNAGGTLLKTTHRLSTPVFTGPGTDFDIAFYLARNPDVAAAGIDPLQHYINSGWKEGRDPNAYFSTTYYLNQNLDVKAAGLNPLAHYAASGWKEGRDPGPAFASNAYLAANPDVKAAGIDPLQHFLINGRAEGRSPIAATPRAVGPQDPLVDRTWYLAQHPDVAASGEDASANYHRIGWKLGYNPDQFFDTRYYLATNPDVAAAKFDPLVHFENSGSREGREPSLAFSDARYLAAYADVKAAGMDPLLHYLSFGRFEGRMTFINGPQQSGTPDPLVDRAYYYAQFATIVPASADATTSYHQTGWKLGYNPDAYFDTNYYLAVNPDIRAAGIDPLQHYEGPGWKEGRNPSAAFSTSKYLAAYSDVQGGAVDPLTSFLTTGQAQGRTAFAV